MQLSTDELLAILKSTVSPESWDETGGHGVIVPTDGEPARLVIAQTQRVHEQIVDLLAQLKLSE